MSNELNGGVLKSNTASMDFSNVIASVSARLEAGEDVSWNEMFAQYPQFEDELKQVIPALEGLFALGVDGSANDRELDLVSSVSPNTTQSLGDFRIIKEIGRGGMGVVYEAQQLSIDRKVALKVLPLAALVDSRALQRFKNEVTAIATLQHSSIVAVYAVGEERGIHYFAMQLIQGQSLAVVRQELRKRVSQQRSINETSFGQIVSELVEEDSLSNQLAGTPADTSDRHEVHEDVETLAQARSTTEKSVAGQNYFRNVARLILQATEALQHAHDHGIVHRDVKPGNLLLDSQGNLCVTDFGLARIETSPGVTMTGDMMGTLRYMSPEQVLANRVVIDHRTDVYSLGATLFEMLALQPIWPNKNKPELIRQISFEEPTRLRNINPSIPADLETIVLKAIDKNPNDRYASAAAFGNDIQCFLDHKPIVARRPTILQRVGKWSYRNQSLVASILAVMLLATIGLAVSNLLILRQKNIADQKTIEARHQKDIADEKTAEALQESKYATAIADFVTNDFLALTSVEGQARFDDFGGYELSNNSTLRELLDRAAEKLDSRTDLEPRIEAQLRWIIGENYLGLCEFSLAIKFLEESTKLHRAAYGDDADETLVALNSLGEAYGSAGQGIKARPLIEEAYEKRKAKLSDDHPDLLESMNDFFVMNNSLEMDQALSIFTNIYEKRKAMLGEDHPDTLESMNNLAAVYLETGQADKAIPMLKQAIELQLTNLGENNQRTLELRANLGSAYTEIGQSDKALAQFKQAFETSKTILGDDHPDAVWFPNKLARHYAGQGRNDEAILLSRKTLERMKTKLGEDHLNTDHSMVNLQGIYLKLGQFENALPVLKQLIEI